eukprot:6193381-Pleurochrysis_carterae.AAC.2
MHTRPCPGQGRAAWTLDGTGLRNQGISAVAVFEVRKIRQKERAHVECKQRTIPMWICLMCI